MFIIDKVMDKIKPLFKNIYFIVFLLVIILLILVILLMIIPSLNKNKTASLSESGSTDSTVNQNSQTESKKTSTSLLVTPQKNSSILVASKKTFANSTELTALINSTKSISPTKTNSPTKTVDSTVSTSSPLPLRIGGSAGQATSSTSNDLTLLTDLLKILLNTNIDTKYTSETGTNNFSPTAQPLNNRLSKTGIFILSGYSAGAKQIIGAKPQIIKIMDPQQNGGLLQAAKDFKDANAGGISVLRIYEGTQNKKYTLNDDPASSAKDFFQSVIVPALNSLGDNKKYFDYIETPNELDNTPGWETTENVTWLSKFWETLIGLNSQAGLRTCVGSIPVGNPPGSAAEIKNSLSFFATAFKKAVINNAAVCYHAYSLNYTTDVSQELASSLRYRIIHQAMSEIDPSFSTLPFILSEAGIDQAGNPQTSGWQARGNGTEYTNWLTWFDGEMNKDNYVLGATLFQIGDDNWSSFNLEPLAGWIAGSIK
jgi:hypothetical protein